MLSDIDKKIIRALQKDGRATHTSLAKKLGIHVSTISKKIQVLEQEGIIQIRALPNPFVLGYTCHAVIGIEAEPKAIENICTRLHKILNVNLIVTTFGRFDIIAVVFFPGWDQLLDFIHVTLSEADGVKNLEAFFVKDIVKRSFGFTSNGASPTKIDETDRNIIEKLSENGRYTANYLARELGISLATCTRRLSNLFREKVVAVKALPNPTKLANNTNALLFIRTEAKMLETICEEIKALKEVPLALKLFSGADLFVVYNAPNPEALYRFVKNDIVSMEGIVGVKTFIRATIKKRYYGGFSDDDPLQDRYDHL